MVKHPYYCLRCVRWYGVSSRSEDSRLCYHCWRYVREYGWEGVVCAPESMPLDFTWRGDEPGLIACSDWNEERETAAAGRCAMGRRWRL